MNTPRPAGRPKAISREMLEEAACELFLERGYADTSVVDITRRAGVSRATFFNYVDSKSDLLWASVDDAIDGVRQALQRGEQVERALEEVAVEFSPGVAVLAFANADAMGLVGELADTGAQRQARLARVIADALRASGRAALEADVHARALAGAFFAAMEAWAVEPPGSRLFSEAVREALHLLGGRHTEG